MSGRSLWVKVDIVCRKRGGQKTQAGSGKHDRSQWQAAVDGVEQREVELLLLHSNRGKQSEGEEGAYPLQRPLKQQHQNTQQGLPHRRPTLIMSHTGILRLTVLEISQGGCSPRPTK